MIYDIVILGATCAALGLVSGLQDHCRVLLLHSTAMVAPEFVNAFKTGTDWPAEAVSAPAAKILAAMKQEHIFQNGDCRIYSAGTIFSQAFNQLQADLLFETDIETIARLNEGYELAICNASGHSRIRTGIIIDTGTAGLDSKTKTLNALLAGSQPAAGTPGDADGVTFLRENDPTPPTVLMRVACPPEESLFMARHRLIDRWRQMAAVNPDWRIAAIALDFDLTLPAETNASPAADGTRLCTCKPDEPDYFSLPSAGFANPLAAIDAGYSCGKGWNR